jgi:hypothetical protein
MSTNEAGKQNVWRKDEWLVGGKEQETESQREMEENGMDALPLPSPKTGEGISGGAPELNGVGKKKNRNGGRHGV